MSIENQLKNLIPWDHHEKVQPLFILPASPRGCYRVCEPFPYEAHGHYSPLNIETCSYFQSIHYPILFREIIHQQAQSLLGGLLLHLQAIALPDI